MLQTHFTAAFAEPREGPTHLPPSPLTWENIQNWEEYRKRCFHHHFLDYEETLILKQLWPTISKVKNRDQVEADLTKASSYCSLFEEFKQSLKQKLVRTAGGTIGDHLPYH